MAKKRPSKAPPSPGAPSAPGKASGKGKRPSPGQAPGQARGEHKNTAPDPSASASQAREEELRQRISAELQEQLALERFQHEHPELWIQASRLGRLMAMQEECPDQEFPPGSCFLYANVPGFQCFALKKVLAVDLDTCQASIDIHSDGELEAGIVLLPLEAMSWFGFPRNAVPLAFPYSGFTTARPLHPEE